MACPYSNPRMMGVSRPAWYVAIMHLAYTSARIRVSNSRPQYRRDKNLPAVPLGVCMSIVTITPSAFPTRRCWMPGSHPPTPKGSPQPHPTQLCDPLTQEPDSTTDVCWYCCLNCVISESLVRMLPTLSVALLVGGRLTQQSCGARSTYAARKVPRPGERHIRHVGNEDAIEKQEWGLTAFMV